MLKRFNSICLIAADVPRIRKFYEAVLGMPAEGDDGFCWFQTRGVGMSIFPTARMTEMAPDYLPPADGNERTFEFEVEDVDQAYARLLELGVTIVKAPTTQPWGIRSVWFRDPAGNIVNFLAPVAGGPKSAEAVVREFFRRVLNERDLAACDALLAADYVDHDAPAGSPPGPADVKKFLSGFLAEVPDLRVEIVDLIAEDNKVAARLTWRGRRLNGEPYFQSGIVFFRLENGKMAERWSVYQMQE
jgi:catechol 2,3-dioxygenase-like lactoylglutathione lyase family enzyme/predicted SnoaL-like aldol condensation-catalyzing enzyme